MGKIAEILGLPRKSDWALLPSMPEYGNLGSVGLHNPGVNRPMGLEKWFRNVVMGNQYANLPPPAAATPSSSSTSSAAATAPASSQQQPPSDEALRLLQALLTYDPLKRITAEEALGHAYFSAGGQGLPGWNCFEGLESKYPARKVSAELAEMGGVGGSLPGTRRTGGFSGMDGIGGKKG